MSLLRKPTTPPHITHSHLHTHTHTHTHTHSPTTMLPRLASLVPLRACTVLLARRCAHTHTSGTHTGAVHLEHEHEHHGHHQDPHRRFIPMYNFERFTREFLHNKPIRWPVGEEMHVAPFRRPDSDQTDEEIYHQQALQPKVRESVFV